MRERPQRSISPAMLARQLGALALAFCCVAAAAAPGRDSGETAQMVKSLHESLARSFVLPNDLPLDPALRNAAVEIRTAHLARIDKLLPAWVDEERRVQAGAGQAGRSAGVYMAVWARLLNELALWQLEPGDPAYERATLEVLKTAPQACRSWGDPRFTDFAGRMLRVQAMPEATRAAALASERTLLSHWGQPRAALAPLPDPLPQDAAAQAVRRMQAGGERAKVALSPMLASSLLAQKKNIAELHPETRCALQQWWFNASLAQGSTPEAALDAFRYATLITARERFAGMFEERSEEGPAAPPNVRAFPKLAAKFGVSGVTTLGVEVDAEGRPKHASVIARKIKVDGIRGVRPVAFEDVFDEGSVRYAMAAPKFTKPAGAGPVRFQMVWTLDEPAGANPPAPKKTGTGAAK